MVYPDPTKPYTLFMDALKYSWFIVLTQSTLLLLMIIPSYISILLLMIVAYSKEANMNRAALTKEAYAIHVTVKKLTFYLADATITLWSDHLPLK